LLYQRSAIGIPVVTPVTDGRVIHCQVASFHPTSSGEEVIVNCYNGTILVDAAFTLSFVSSSQPDSGAPGAYGWVYNDQPTYSNPLKYNSTGGPVEIYLNQSTGIWTVRFFGAAFNNLGGNVVVTSVAAIPIHCAVTQWYPHVLGADAQVRCDKLTANPSIVPQWTLVYSVDHSILGTRAGDFAYLQANQPTAAAYTPDPNRNRPAYQTLTTISRTASTTRCCGARIADQPGPAHTCNGPSM
jgi:hypothetical protein